MSIHISRKQAFLFIAFIAYVEKKKPHSILFIHHLIHHYPKIHGEQDYWQCSKYDCSFPVSRAPDWFRFKVDSTSMLAPKGESVKGTSNDEKPKESDTQNGDEKSVAVDPIMAAFSSNHPQCTICKDYLRPYGSMSFMFSSFSSFLLSSNILMFGDHNWKRRETSVAWYRWTERVTQLCAADPTKKVVILEVREQATHYCRFSESFAAWMW